jgi:putative hydrolase of HD superfamily
VNDKSKRADGCEGSDLAGVARFVFEVGHLKRVPRTGWFLAGVDAPESVAEHTARTTVIALLLSALSPDSVNAGRVAMMCSIHDMAETRTGDVPSVGKKYLVKSDDLAVLDHQLAGVPPKVRDALTQLIIEYDERATIEARLARDADKIECLAQALEYQRVGVADVHHWVQGAYESITTEVGHALADAILAESPDSWWRDFVASYRTTLHPSHTDGL